MHLTKRQGRSKKNKRPWMPNKRKPTSTTYLHDCKKRKRPKTKLQPRTKHEETKKLQPKKRQHNKGLHCETMR